MYDCAIIAIEPCNIISHTMYILLKIIYPMEYEKYIYYSYDLFDGDIISFKAKHINNSYFIKNN